jgi:uroporphyrin-III C-methyltransferase
VVRVKGGEALLFGRAGEELAVLREAGITVEIVNGITSGFAAAAGLGISLTHRRHCHGVSFVTAHTEDHGEPDWAALAATRTTLAIYMGMRRIASIAGALLESLPGDTPAAVVQWAGGINERRLLTRLDRLADDATNAGFDSPAVILVGSAIGESVERMCGEHDGQLAAAAAMNADDALARETIAYAA